MWFSSFAAVAAISSLGWAQPLKDSERASLEGTTYNSLAVPPLLELTPDNWEKVTKKSRWLLVKHYSPYCPHCSAFAPVFQTLYEFYYTSKPVPGSRFSDFYGFQFGTINCVAYSDLCSSHGIESFPTTILFEHGQRVDSLQGVRNMTALSDLIEAALEKTKPNSRPKTLNLPEPGDKENPKDSAQPPAEDSTDLPTKATDQTPAQKKIVGKDSLDVSAQPPTAANKLLDTAEKLSGPIEASEAKKNARFPGRHDSAPSSNRELTDGFQKQFEKRPKKLSATTNTNGISVPLTAESFQKLVTMTQDPWFIKFHVPWCPHCQALGPSWEQLAKSMRGKLNIGEVNCEKESRLCKDVHVQAYPTILFFKGADRAEYNGLRGLGDLVQYADKGVDLAAGVPDVDAETFKELEKKEDVIFVYFYDHATTSEDFLALERLPLSLIGHAKLVKTKDQKMYNRFKITTWPRLLVSREGRPTYYPPLTPDEMRDVRGLLDWMRSVWLPLVPELTPSNARQIMERKLVVLGILKHEDQEAFQGSIREMKSAANEWMDRQIHEYQLERKKLRDSKQMRIEEAEDRGDQRALRAAKAIRINMDTSGRKEVTFAWVDGVYWQRWIRTTFGVDVKDGERIVIHDEDNRRYWDTTVTGNYILVSRTSIMETLDKVVNSPHVLKHKLTVSALEKIIFDIRAAFSEHLFLALACVGSLGFAFVSWLRGRSRRARGAAFRLDDSNKGIRELKDGLLGAANGNQKAD